MLLSCVNCLRGVLVMSNRRHFYAWAPYGRRSESLANKLDAELHFIHYLKFQNPIYAPLKYILQGIKTHFILLTQQPAVVFIQNPPIFCSLSVYIHSLFFGTKFVLDHHSDVFSDRWNWIGKLQRYLVRKAALNLVTNDHLLNTIESWGGKGMILEDALPEFPEVEPYPVRDGTCVVMVNTFAPDEPLAEVVETARMMPEVSFYITGNKANQSAEIFENNPDNVIFTNFLPDQEYIGLLKACDAVMALTTRDHTLQGGGFEAVALGKPLITSDWPLLHFLFQKGTVYVDNSAISLKEAIASFEDNYETVSETMRSYREEKRAIWQDSLQEMLDKLT
jgi:glycosyltransferase involved in cell wall biosynthesis